MAAASWLTGPYDHGILVNLYLASLLVNCVYPLLLLLPTKYSSSMRRAVASTDAFLDFCYCGLFFLQTGLIASFDTALPSTIYACVEHALDRDTSPFLLSHSSLTLSCLVW